jgi:hypothetical protein
VPPSPASFRIEGILVQRFVKPQSELRHGLVQLLKNELRMPVES